MRLFLFILLMTLFVFFIKPIESKAIHETNISAQHAIIIESDSGRVIFEKDAYEEKPIASITKIMTALIAIEEGNLQDTVTISASATNTYGSAIYIKQNEKWTLEDLLYGLMLRSGNDAAIAIAEHIAGSEAGFVFLMNEKAKKLGMTSTKFMNAHGLHDDKHYSTAYDMAILMKEAVKNKQFQTISSTSTYRAKNHPYPWHNKNKLLTSLYPPTTGGKTGFTKKAGRTFVSSAEKDGVSYIAVSLNAADDWNDHIKMYEEAFQTYERVILAKKGSFTFKKDQRVMQALVDNTYYYPLEKTEREKLHQQIIWKNDQANKAKLIYLLDGDIIAEIPLQIKEEKNKSWLTALWQKILALFGADAHG